MLEKNSQYTAQIALKRICKLTKRYKLLKSVNLSSTKYNTRRFDELQWFWVLTSLRSALFRLFLLLGNIFFESATIKSKYFLFLK